MAATKGHPKWGGRKRGTTNKVTGQLRETISCFLENNFSKIEKDFKKLSPRERAKLYCDLLQYGLPKLQSVTLENRDGTANFSPPQIILNLPKE